MPVQTEWKRSIEEKIKPYGKAKWTDVATQLICQFAKDKERLTILDVGCGVDSWIIRKVRETYPALRAIGIDVDPDCINNSHLNETYVASADCIPLESESIDLVVSVWVVEHLRCPLLAFREINRVLKPGGVVVFCTPNLYNPVMLVSKFSPRWFHTWIRKLSYGSEHAENAATYYRSNTVHKLKKIAVDSGFVCEYMRQFSGAYNYFSMCKAFFVTACILNKLTAIWPFSRTKLTLLCVFRKH